MLCHTVQPRNKDIAAEEHSVLAVPVVNHILTIKRSEQRRVTDVELILPGQKLRSKIK
jgi:hypothetical protein